MKPRKTLLPSAVLSIATVAALSTLMVLSGSGRSSPERRAEGACAPVPAAEVSLPPAPLDAGVERDRLESVVPEEPREAAAPPVPRLAEQLAELEVSEAQDELHALASDDDLTRSLAGELSEVAGAAHLDERLRGLAVWALARTGDARAAQEQIVPENPRALRLTSIEMLRRHGGARTASLLAPLAGSDADSVVREAALRSLWLLDAPGAAPICAEIAGEDHRPLQGVALELLARLEPPPERPKHGCALAR